MHSDLHSAGYFLNPQFQFGLVHGRDVARETLDGTTKVIRKLEPDINIQVRANNQLLLFRDKRESFGTLQAQQAWSNTDPGQTPSQSGEGGLSPPSDGNSGGNGGGGNQEQVHGISEGSHDSFEEDSHARRDLNLLSRGMEEESRGGGSSRGRAKRGKSKKHEATPFHDSSSSSGVQSYGDFGFVAPFEEPPRSSGIFDYVFGRSGNNNDEGDSGSYDPARRSTMW
ncbi:hypothetical protein QL285_077390 [Trifolium repens]|nr:hypothetical protein QL285_077390 [Trifolium repens]